MSHGGCGLTSAQTVELKLKTSIGGIEALHVHVGNDAANMAFQVVCVSTTSAPSLGNLKKLYADRHGNYLYPLVVRALHGSNASLFGPNPESTVWEISNEQAERVLQDALNQPSGFVAQQKYSQHRKAFMSAANLGVANAGLFANYYLQNAITTRKDWLEHCERGTSLLKHRGKDLVHQLGFTESFASADAILLSGTATGHKRAVAILLNEDEQFEAHSHRFNLTPIAYGLSVAAKNDVPWLMVLRGSEIRLYPAKDGVGVGQRSQAETYFELNLSVIPENQIGLLDLVFSASALEAGGTVEELLNGSARFATDLGSRLRARIYEHVVPELAKGVAQQLPNLGLEVNAANLTLAYRLTLRILFRLLFQAYAEDKGLLPYERNERFTANALKTLVIRDLIPNAENAFDENSTALWDDLAQVWKVIDGGDSAWNIPAYNGGLFGNDSERQPEGALINRLAIPNHIMGPALKHMLVDTTEEGTLGPVDFGSLSVREFGTIYEGLLESSLSLADSDLTLDKNGAWIPAQPGDTVEAAKGTAYFHNSSGERKATGSYFTPSIIVEHLLDRALEPALENHLAKVKALVDQGKESEAADLFFDFRVADLAMGSAHFLVAAVDRIETAFRNFMVETHVPKVRAELKRLGDAARIALGSDAEFVGDIDDALLLRRQIARRCIYGIDINDMAVELARLALWIHTFVPGLPMSSLDHGLVCANSLTGIGTIDEALQALDPKAGQGALFSEDILAGLMASRDLLLKASAADEATKQEIEAARELAARAKKASAPTRHIFDAAVAARLDMVTSGSFFSIEAMIDVGMIPEVVAKMDQLRPAHMPYLFPEVFLREDPGFDVLVGNPPWEKVKIEQHQWWGVRLPGLRGLPMGERNLRLGDFKSARPDLVEAFAEESATVEIFRNALVAGPFEGIGAGGDPDLYQAFAWRNWRLARRGGCVGLVLPRGAHSGPSLEQWRQEILREGSFSSVVFATNSSAWMFKNVHPQYTVGMTVIEKTPRESVFFGGPAYSLEGFRRAQENLVAVPKDEFINWSSVAGFPLLPDADSATIYRRMHLCGALGRRSKQWDFRPVAELHSTANKDLLDFDLKSEATADVMTGKSFNLWENNFGPLAARADRGRVENFLEEKLPRQRRLSRSAFFSATDSELTPRPWARSRIAFRDVTNQTNTRTTIACLIAPGVFLLEGSPYFYRRSGSPADEAYLLGILCSTPFDWASRRWVEGHLKQHILEHLPFPHRSDSSVARGGRVITIAARLGATDLRYSDWAHEAGVQIASVKSDQEKAELLAELDALAFLLYQLDEDQVRHIFETFHKGVYDHDHLERVLRYYQDWKDKA
jgi:hypothetical protein